jgi:predicted fused transcriptional regulator/phosphomethylpyrimidine kinase
MMDNDRYYVMGQMVEAIALLTASPNTYSLLPEIRSNLVMATKDAITPEDITGIPGRLTAVFGKITAPAYPAWGASKYTAMILLEVRKIKPDICAAMEIRYDPKLVHLILSHNISIARLDIREGDSLDAILKECIHEGILPDLFYSEGGFAREGAIIITGIDAVTVAELVVKIAEWADYEIPLA